MAKLTLLLFILWLAVFSLRVFSIGGLDPSFRDQPFTLLDPLRNYFGQVIDTILPFPQSAVLIGMLLGDGAKIPFLLKKDFQTTSTIHLLVVSGQNLSILVGFLMGLVYLAGRTKTIIISLLAITLYSLLTGLGVPILRSAVMSFTILFGQLLGRNTISWYILSLTLTILLLINPDWLFSISFQLSFLATSGVIMVSPIIQKQLKVLPNLINIDLSTSISAYALTLPVIAYNFGQISLIGVAANILVIWTAPLILISGFFSLILRMINTTLGMSVGLVPTVLITYLIYIVEILSKLPFAQISILEGSLLFWLGYYLLVIGLTYFLKIRQTS